jgi:protein-L-isoaspartate(D-aspartate) O-methyltransferase
VRPPRDFAQGATERARLVATLRERGAIRSDAVAAAFEAVPREIFIPDVLAREGIEALYRDEAFVTKRHARGMPISSSSQPRMMAEMLELLDVGPGDRVLEVGAGTGYNAALLRRLVGRRGRVTTIDVDPALARSARAALRQAGSPASVVVGDGRAGWVRQAPYDRIIVTACADQLPKAWLAQLAPGGRLITPLRLDPDGAAIQLIPAFTRDGERLLSVGMTWGGFMALHDGDGGWRPPPDSVSASRSVRGEHVLLASITGPGLRGAGAASARRLLTALVAGGGERRAHGRTTMGSGRAPLLFVYLLLAIPDRRRVSVMSDGRMGIGIVRGRGSSLAVLSVPSPWTTRTQPARGKVGWRLDGYGDADATDELAGLIARWRELETEGRVRLGLLASAQGDERALRIRFRWT